MLAVARLPLRATPHVSLTPRLLEARLSGFLPCHLDAAWGEPVGAPVRELEAGAGEKPRQLSPLSDSPSSISISLRAASVAFKEVKPSPRILHLGDSRAKDHTLLCLFPQAPFFAT